MVSPLESKPSPFGILLGNNAAKQKHSIKPTQPDTQRRRAATQPNGPVHAAQYTNTHTHTQNQKKKKKKNKTFGWLVGFCQAPVPPPLCHFLSLQGAEADRTTQTNSSNNKQQTTTTFALLCWFLVGWCLATISHHLSIRRNTDTHTHTQTYTDTENHATLTCCGAAGPGPGCCRPSHNRAKLQHILPRSTSSPMDNQHA